MKAIVTQVLLPLIGIFVISCGGVEPGTGSTESTSQALNDGPHGCKGLQNAFDHCHDDDSCDKRMEQLVAHNCVPAVACPCTDAPFNRGGLPVSFTKCPAPSSLGIQSLVLCSGGVNDCEFPADPNNPPDPAACDLCRQQYNVVCGPQS